MVRRVSRGVPKNITLRRLSAKNNMSKENKTNEAAASTESQSSNLSTAALASELAAERKAPASPKARATQAKEREEDENEQSSEVSEEVEIEVDSEQPETEREESDQDNPADGDQQEADGEDEGDVENEEGDEADEEEDGKSTLHDEVKSILREVGAEPNREKALTKMASRMQKSLRQRDEAVAELQELKESGAGNVDLDSLIQNNDQALIQLDGEMDQLKRGIAKLKANRESGLTIKKDGEVYELTPEQVEARLEEWEEALEERRTQRTLRRREIQQERETIAAEARSLTSKHYNWVNDPKHDDYALARAELKQLGPVGRILASDPRFNLIVGRYVAGLKAEMAKGRVATPAKPALGSRVSGGREPAPIGASRSAVPPRNNDEDSRQKKAKQRFESTGRVSDLANELAEEHARKVQKRRK